MFDTHNMTIKATNGKSVESPVKYWKPTMKALRAHLDKQGINPDAWLLAQAHKAIKHRAINLKAQDVREALTTGKDLKAKREAWLKAAEEYRPGLTRQRGIVTQKRAQEVMLKLAQDDPEAFAKLMTEMS